MLNRYIFTGVFSVLAVQALLSTPAEAATSVPFQRYLNSDCSTGTDCTIDFPVVAAGKRMDIFSTSCYTRFTGFASDVDIAALQLLVVNPKGTILNAVTLKNVLQDSNGTYSAFAASETIVAFAGPGARFQAFMRYTKGKLEQFACHISGAIVSP